MRIWLVTVGEPLAFASSDARPWRTGLLAQTMARRGHDVVWWISNVDHFKKVVVGDEFDGVELDARIRIRLLRGRFYRHNLSWARYRNHIELGKYFVENCTTETLPDLIVVSLPTIELAQVAARFGRAMRVPVIVDIRDLWPDEIYSRIPSVVRPLCRIVFARLEQAVKSALQNAHSLTAVSDQYLRWGLERAGRAKGRYDRVFTHGYPDPTASRGAAQSLQGHSELRRKIAGRRVVWYVGTFVGSKDLVTVIDAASSLQDIRDIVFVLSGSGELDRELRKYAEALPNVVFTGWLDREDLDACARLAWVGLGAYKRGTLVSLTNKIFEYLAYGIPVLIALQGEARHIIEEAGAGVYYEPGDAAELAATIRALVREPRRRDNMALRARALFESRYAANRIYNEMADHLEAIGNAEYEVP